MKKNVGGYDRIARLVIGPVLLLAGIAGYVGWLVLAFGPVPQALASILVFLVGAILAVTGVFQKCPLKRVLGFDTYRASTDEPESRTADPHD
jgi:hypothetical protein